MRTSEGAALRPITDGAQVEDAERRVGDALNVSNMPALRSQLAAATKATAVEDLWDDPQVSEPSPSPIITNPTSSLSVNPGFWTADSAEFREEYWVIVTGSSSCDGACCRAWGASRPAGGLSKPLRRRLHSGGITRPGSAVSHICTPPCRSALHRPQFVRGHRS